jgi:cytochrome c-type biogenesis protein CcmI
MAEANAAVYRRQVTELESDLRHGLITRAQFERDREERHAQLWICPKSRAL